MRQSLEVIFFAEDAYIGEHRRWYRQFYSDEAGSGRPRLQVTLTEEGELAGE
jgi:hypothetical protein